MIRQSEAINDLAVALTSAQSQMSGAVKDAKNPFFKSNYADLESIMDAIKEPLNKNGLAVTQLSTLIEGHWCIATRIMHKSGQWLEGYFPIVVSKQNDAQAMGSATTYARRYALAAAFCVPQVDDDGNAASKPSERSTHVTMAPTQTEVVLGDDSDLGNYVISIGKKHVGKKLSEMDPSEIHSFMSWLKESAFKDKKPLSGKADEFVKAASAYLSHVQNEQIGNIKF